MFGACVLILKDRQIGMRTWLDALNSSTYFVLSKDLMIATRELGLKLLVSTLQYKQNMFSHLNIKVLNRKLSQGVEVRVQSTKWNRYKLRDNRVTEWNLVNTRPSQLEIFLIPIRDLNELQYSHLQ